MVRVEVRVRVMRNTFKYVFGQTSVHSGKNDVISFFLKGFCALGLGLRLELELPEIRFGQTSIRASILDPKK